MTGKQSSGVQVLDRAFRILDALAAARHGLALRELADSLGLPKPTLHRLLASLIEHGYVRRNAQAQRYELGLRAVELGRMALSGLDLRSCSRRYLDDLVLRSSESARLAILDGTEVVYIDGADAPTNLRPISTIGHRAPAHATAMGKALLASLDARALTAFFERNTLTPLTRWTRTDPPSLQDELATVLRRGFAVEREEYEEGLACVAAVIRNHNGAIEGAIGLSGPAQRMPPDRIARELGPLIAISALSVSRDLGWTPPESSLAEIEEAAERARTAAVRL